MSTLKKIWQKYNPKIEKELKKEFVRDILRDNFFRLSFLSIIMLLFEFVLYFFQEVLYGVGIVILCFLGVSVVLIPIILYTYKKIKTVNATFALAVQFIYLSCTIVFSAALSLFIQGDVDLVHMYVMVILGATAFLHMSSTQSAILLSSTLLFYLLALPYFETVPETRFVISVNVVISNIVAWLLNKVLWTLKIKSFSTQKMLYEKNKLLQKLNQHDSMTGLLNHETSLKKLEQEISRSKSAGYPVSLIITDIDNFKSVNDNHGHQSGDQVLKKIADTLSHIVRSTDYVGRYGGEEFIIIMPNTNLKSAYALTKRIQKAIRNVDLNANIKVTLSGGVSELNGESLNELIRITDKKLYKAKGSGKDRFETSVNLS